MYKAKIRSFWRLTDSIILVIGFFLLAYTLTAFYPYLELFKQFYAVLLIGGVVIGITIAWNQYQKEELFFLFLQAYNIRIISFVNCIRFSLPSLVVFCIVLTSLLFYQGSVPVVIKSFLTFMIGYYIGGNASNLLYISKSNKLVLSSSSLLICVLFLFYRNIKLEMVISVLYILWYWKLSIKHWKVYFKELGVTKQRQFKTFITKYPVLKKEFHLIFHLQRVVPLIIVFIVGQFGYPILYELHNKGIVILTIVLILLMHDSWTINAIGLEGTIIKLYIYSNLSLRKLILTKWIICFFIPTIIGISNYTIWSLIYKESVFEILQNVTLLIFVSLLISALYMYIGIYFSDFNRTSYYRINIHGIIISIVGVVCLFFCYFLSLLVVIVITIIITFMLWKTIHAEEKLRSLLNKW